MFKKEIVSLLSRHVALNKEEISSLLEVPLNEEFGDYAFPCFRISKNPIEIAKQVAKKLKAGEEVERIEAVGPYINFFINKNKLAEQILRIKEDYGKKKEKGKKIMVEFPSPNTNKPLHLGHLRNMAIGESISRILEFSGNTIIRTNLNNDRGIHICKSMIAYEKWGKNNNPKKAKKKSDHFVGDYYVLFNKKAKQNPELEKQAQIFLQKWEKADKKTLQLWKKMNKWALDGFKQTYKLFGIKFNKEYFESETYKKGKEIVEEGLKKGIFIKQPDNSIIIKIGQRGKEDLGEKILLRADGTSVYVTQDLYLAKLKQKQYHPDTSIYVVGNEQNYHFKVLFLILKKLGFKQDLHHLSYGMVNLPSGKMKSREGEVIDADDFIKNIQALSKKELKKRYKLSKKELENRSLKIALSAIKYALLKVDSSKNMLFNPKEAISFEGDTGPYLQYSYARASSILRKAKTKKRKKGKKSKNPVKQLVEKEIRLVKKIDKFPEIIALSSSKLNPSFISNYAVELAHIFNDFYHSCPVIGDESESLRLSLVKAFKITIKNALYLLGIEVMEEM